MELERYMQFAIEEGRKAVHICADNPPVGCVFVKDGIVVSAGHTNAPGSNHAEAMALNQLNGATNGVVLFVTLEPCSFHGRTPSCAKALIDSGVKTVYVGILDPDPRNSGKGIEMLKNAGIEVHVGILEQVVMSELKNYLGKAP